jgi:uncharacterized membrane protein
MTGIALAIVLSAGFLHAGWNFLLKKSSRKIVFTWWFLLVALILYLPMFLYFWPQTPISVNGWRFVLATGLIHGFYFWFMGGAYERGDLSLVYPLARGFGPMLVPVLAVVLLKEQLSVGGIFGISAVIAGIFVIHLRSFSPAGITEPFRALRGGASLWALLTGTTIAAYSLVDKVGVRLVHPPVYIYLMMLIAWLFITPYVLAMERPALSTELYDNKRIIVLVGFLCVFTYMLVLFAMQMSKISYVVAAREVSIIFSTYYGIIRLREKHAKQKFVGAMLIALGVFLIGISR